MVAVLNLMLLFSDEETVNRLIDASFDVKEFAYSPYSKFRVGAALLCEDGTIISGLLFYVALTYAFKFETGHFWPV